MAAERIVSEPDTLTAGMEGHAPLPLFEPREGLAPAPLAQRWIRRLYWTLFVVFIALALLYAFTTWRAQRQILYGSLDTSSSFLVSATQSYFQSFSSVLDATGSDLAEKADLLQHPEVLQIFLERRQALLPGALSISVVSVDGRLLGSSLRSDKLPDLQHYPDLVQAFARMRALPQQKGLIIARPVIDPPGRDRVNSPCCCSISMVSSRSTTPMGILQAIVCCVKRRSACSPFCGKAR